MAIFSKPKVFYRGFSTGKFASEGKTFSLTDIELVKADLLNHIYTKPGERVMMPGFGTRIPDLVFEPLDRHTIAIIEEDLRMVIAYDPRVNLKSLNVYALPNNNSIIAVVELYYIEFNVSDTLNLEIAVGS